MSPPRGDDDKNEDQGGILSKAKEFVHDKFGSEANDENHDTSMVDQAKAKMQSAKETIKQKVQPEKKDDEKEGNGTSLGEKVQEKAENVKDAALEKKKNVEETMKKDDKEQEN